MNTYLHTAVTTHYPLFFQAKIVIARRHDEAICQVFAVCLLLKKRLQKSSRLLYSLRSLLMNRSVLMGVQDLGNFSNFLNLRSIACSFEKIGNHACTTSRNDNFCLKKYCGYVFRKEKQESHRFFKGKCNFERQNRKILRGPFSTSNL